MTTEEVEVISLEEKCGEPAVRLGKLPRFDLRDFHEILLEGAMPLTILERRVDERIKARLAGSMPERG